MTTYGGVDAAIDFRTGEASFWKPSTSSYYGLQRRRAEPSRRCAWAGTTRTRSPASRARRPATAPSSSRTAGGPTSATPGYFWLSYYDASFGDALAVFGGVEGVGNYDAIYQYDALGRSGWIDALGRSADSRRRR